MQATLSFYEQLIAEEVVGIISSEDQVILDTAKEDFPEIRKLWEEAQAIFSQPGIRDWLKQIPPAPPLRPKHTISSYKPMWLAAASILVLAITTWFFYPRNEPNISPLQATTTCLLLPNGESIDLSNKHSLSTEDMKKLTRELNATLIVPPGKDFKVTFAEGTEIHVNSASSLYFPVSFNNDTREITLIGEAYLTVARNPDQPLLVKTPGGEVTVLGTEFNINSYEKNKMEVALVIGKVKVKAGEKSLTLQPGYSATCKGDNIRTELLEEDQTSWRDGVQYFKHKPLKEVFEIIPRWLGYKIAVENETAGLQPITGVLDKNISIRENMDVLKASNPIDYYIDKDSVVHIRKTQE